MRAQYDGDQDTAQEDGDGGYSDRTFERTDNSPGYVWEFSLNTAGRSLTLRLSGDGGPGWCGATGNGPGNY